jgi:hypothetical protein
MGVKISDIKNTRLQAIAKQIDNGDGVLKRKEYAIFAQAASAQGMDAKAISDALDMNWLQRWWYDVDKVSTDGKDDGKLSFWDGAKSYAKGLFGGLVKNIVKNPLESLITIGAFAGGLAVLGLVASPLIAAGVGVAAGIGFGAAALVKGINQTRNAETDCEAKMGLENAGTGTSMIALSGLGLKGLSSKMKAKSVKPVESVKPKEEVVAENITDDQIRVIGEETQPVKPEGIVIKNNPVIQRRTSMLIRAKNNYNNLKETSHWEVPHTIMEILQRDPKIVDMLSNIKTTRGGKLFKEDKLMYDFLEQYVRSYGKSKSWNPQNMDYDIIINNLKENLNNPEFQQLLLSEGTPMRAVQVFFDYNIKHVE